MSSIDSVIYSYKPMNNSLRFRKGLKTTFGSPRIRVSGLFFKKSRSKFRNTNGNLVSYNRSFGNKKLFRLIDTKRSFLDFKCKILQLEYDPNRTANIALVKYINGSFSYVLGVTGMSVGLDIVSSNSTDHNLDFSIGNSFMLKSLPLGSMICNLELSPSKGGQVIKSAGMYGQIVYKSDDLSTVNVLLKNGTVVSCLGSCKATLGMVSNSNKKLVVLGKAGVSRWLGRRPHVRGVAMNPVDHPHGGGNGKTSGGRPSVSR